MCYQFRETETDPLTCTSAEWVFYVRDWPLYIEND